VYAGTYKEQVFINRPKVTIIGESRQTTRFSSNTVHITNSLPASQAGSNDLSGTVRVSNISTDVKLYNCKSREVAEFELRSVLETYPVNISNTYGKVRTRDTQALRSSGNFDINITL
jgi:pectin methylesterase-like acyl-CoA thioesterase